MSEPTTEQIEAAVLNDPDNAELRYLLGADLAQRREYDRAIAEIGAALELRPTMPEARFQLGLLHLTQGNPQSAREVWAPLDQLSDRAALKHFKAGLEALIVDDFKTCLASLEEGIRLNTANEPLNRDMSLVLERTRALLGAPADGEAAARTDFSLYGSRN